MKTLIGLLFAVLGGGAYADCTFQVSGPSNHTYSEQDIITFVTSEIRPVLAKTSTLIPIRIAKVCDGSVVGTLQLTMDSEDYYIVQVQQHHLSEEESKYTDSNLTLSRAGLDEALDKSISFDGLSLQDRQDAVKTFAFYFAESARFTDIENIANALLAGNCTQDWTKYAHLLRRWARISKNALQHGDVSDLFHGGVNDNLLAPISQTMIVNYNAANPADQVSVPAPSCERLQNAQFGAQ
ncbi:hypothetical protein BTH42_26780 [Burkholderia sp. SRS-W-2-2016]|uniref:ribosome-inactivating family protein n=1 Tax=Burkholderia sp. SRS-W-2-2016 TaxID=1926878 RepID=UPI00094AF127|nr:ribosome-inactivating family protein [Burkholderia sp. SRS-W-2-2016]OLL28604.1 hypothetical protein BTH42_26780 [Burkholderia sp. SRS-W-2-2016]